VLAVGANEIPVVTPVMLAAGTYWFMADYNVNARIGNDGATTNQDDYTALTYGNALPLTFPTPTIQAASANAGYYVIGTTTQ
jgi:hypothetical protein